MSPQRILLILDGNSLTHRAYHALGPSPRNPNPLTNSAGRPSWALHGFFASLAGMCEMTRATDLLIGFDNTLEVNYRKESYPDYKATRDSKGDDLYLQMEDIITLLKELGVLVVEPKGWEADDVVASAALAATEAGWKSVIATGDRDSFACISETTTVLRMMPGGLEKAIWMTPKALFDKCEGITPSQYVDYAAMRGDKSDNLDGVLGIGEKAAGKILTAFGSVEEALTHEEAELAAAVGKSVAKKLLAGVENWRRNVELMAGHTDIPIDLSKTALDKDANTASEIMRKWELPSAAPRTGKALAGKFVLVEQESADNVPLSAYSEYEGEESFDFEPAKPKRQVLEVAPIGDIDFGEDPW